MAFTCALAFTRAAVDAPTLSCPGVREKRSLVAPGRRGFLARANRINAPGRAAPRRHPHRSRLVSEECSPRMDCGQGIVRLASAPLPMSAARLFRTWPHGITRGPTRRSIVARLVGFANPSF